MGIPMWREPTEAESIKTARNKDTSAATRSTIRRQPTLRRPSRHNSSRTRGPGVLSSFHSQILDEIQRGIAEPQLGVRSPVLNQGVSDDGLDLDSSRRDALSHGGTRPSDNRQPDLSSRRTQVVRDPDPPLPMREAQIEDPIDTPPWPLPLTPHFPPAAAYYTSIAYPPSSRPVRLPLPSLPNVQSLRRMENRNHGVPSRLPSVSHLPPGMLRDYRTGSSLSRSNRESAIDGLGDRQRSLSPDAERETDVWDTLLSTITPDSTLPSTDTSFSSTSASGTDPSRNPTSRTSGASSQTQPSSRAAHLALDPYPDHLTPCDFPSDDEDTPVHRGFGASSLPLSLRRSTGLHSTMSSHPPIPTISFSFSDSGDSDLQQMQAILDRLARREDIPDDWWAGAGLSRTMGRGLSASAEGNENNRTE
ncbi:hypothetical protein PENDEC_c003G06784 [Penicillium decumbens]|uniref:Uncharacterized protein n=1 Tax=Penicillium decumbens TaxID=69771 RepID=A0A1V6PIP9_PENDC|nr:hypothetical protein PENDEC_c003G06784 [Penicillium decumbens]